MKLLVTSLLTVVLFSATAQTPDFFTNANTFFADHVKSGLIEYESIKENPTELNVLVRQIANYLIAGKTPEQQKAFYTNAYNILVIKQVVDELPIDGPWDIDGFFSKTIFKVAGRDVTLDGLEKQILFPAFPDPRLHFVLVCAAIGCPPISNYAYVPDSLETMLDRKTREVLNINWYVRVYKDKTLISKVFDWYKKDFESDTSDIKGYINQYREIAIPENHTLDTYEYDWSLNDAKNSFRY
ncbi:MAG: DUF547 domain-containing protein [Marinoscillum sp.]